VALRADEHRPAKAVPVPGERELLDALLGQVGLHVGEPLLRPLIVGEAVIAVDEGDPPAVLGQGAAGGGTQLAGCVRDGGLRLRRPIDSLVVHQL
jgi:hypothetical protein